MALDLVGQKFGRLLVISKAPKKEGTRHVYWNCKCDCGNERAVYANHLRSGVQVSCGCFARDKHTSHGLSRSPEYNAWAQMIQRCENPKNPKYPRYGARGILVSPEWHDFETFYSDMGDSAGLTLDRIDNDGNYEKGNCRWTTYAQQNSNHSRNRVYSYGGETLTMTQWAARLSIHPTALYYRIERYKWPLSRALTTMKGNRE